MSESYASSLSPMARVIYEALLKQTDPGDVESVTETAVSIAPPIDLEELALEIQMHEVRSLETAVKLKAALVESGGDGRSVGLFQQIGGTQHFKNDL
jgi:hypothetical protein